MNKNHRVISLTSTEGKTTNNHALPPSVVALATPHWPTAPHVSAARPAIPPLRMGHEVPLCLLGPLSTSPLGAPQHHSLFVPYLLPQILMGVHLGSCSPHSTQPLCRVSAATHTDDSEIRTPVSTSPAPSGILSPGLLELSTYAFLGISCSACLKPNA